MQICLWLLSFVSIQHTQFIVLSWKVASIMAPALSNNVNKCCSQNVSLDTQAACASHICLSCKITPDTDYKIEVFELKHFQGLCALSDRLITACDTYCHLSCMTYAKLL